MLPAIVIRQKYLHTMEVILRNAFVDRCQTNHPGCSCSSAVIAVPKPTMIPAGGFFVPQKQIIFFLIKKKNDVLCKKNCYLFFFFFLFIFFSPPPHKKNFFFF